MRGFSLNLFSIQPSRFDGIYFQYDIIKPNKPSLWQRNEQRRSLETLKVTYLGVCNIQNSTYLFFNKNWLIYESKNKEIISWSRCDNYGKSITARNIIQCVIMFDNFFLSRNSDNYNTH